MLKYSKTLIQPRYPSLSLLYKQPTRWPLQIESILVRSEIDQLHISYQEEIILNKVVLKSLNRQRPISKSRHEVVFCMLFPSSLNVRSLQQILYKAPARLIYQPTPKTVLQTVNSRREWKRIARVKVINRTIALAQIARRLNTHFYIPTSIPHCLLHRYPFR